MSFSPLRPAAAVGFVLAVALGEASSLRADPGDDGRLPPAAEVSARLDQLLAAEWARLGVTPAAPASDAEFLRRASLDLSGVIPSEDAARAFLADPSPTRRAHLVERLLDSPAHARSMAARWSALLVGRAYELQALGVKERQERARGRLMAAAPEDDELPDEALTLGDWLEERIAQNVGWDRVARELIAAKGTVTDAPAAHYALRHLRGGKPEELAGHVMRVFQALPIQCAQCHDHPYAQWTQRQFYGVAAFLARTRAGRSPPSAQMIAAARAAGRDPTKVQGAFQVVDRPAGQARIPAAPGQVGPLILPRFLTGEVIHPGAGVDRRGALADLVTGPGNPWFARAIANRAWSFLFGRGLLEPVDDLNDEDGPLPPALLLLADDLRRSGHDMRRLYTVIAGTRAYGLSSAGPADGRGAQVEAFARAALRPLSAEQLYDSVLEATGALGIRAGARGDLRRLQRRKLELLRQFVRTFGDDEGDEAVEEGTIPQALMRLNGPLTNEAVRPRPGHPVYDRLFRTPDLDQRIDGITLRTLGRYATDAERALLREQLAPRPAAELAEAYADVFWALLNSSEFNFNH